MNRYRSARMRKHTTLVRLLTRHSTPEVKHYYLIQDYPRSLRFAALTVLRERRQI